LSLVIESLPTVAEVETVWQPLVKWVVLCAVVLVILALNQLLYRILVQVCTSSITVVNEVVVDDQRVDRVHP
jgi:hypothetical protein